MRWEDRGPFHRQVNLRLSDPAYTERLAAFLRSLGHSPIIAGPDQVELDLPGEGNSAKAEMEIYLRVWRVLYPDALVDVANGF